MGYRRAPSYIAQLPSGSYQLQRGVPRALRQAIGKAIFKGASYPSIHQARAQVPGFLQTTELEIRKAKGEDLTPSELMIQIGQVPGLLPGDMVDMCSHEGMYLDGSHPNPKYERLQAVAEAVQAGKAGKLLTTEGLLQARRIEREPAPRTYASWVTALKIFMEFSGHEYPYQATKQDAIGFRDHLLGRQGRNSVKTQLALLAGLWTTLTTRQPQAEHIFKGLPNSLTQTTKAKALQGNTAKRNRSFEPPTPINEWQGSKRDIQVFTILYYTGARLAEIAALNAEDIHDDHIIIEWSEDRSLKTANSVRDIPIHPSLIDELQALKKEVGSGSLWPSLRTQTTIGGEVIVRWGHNLSKPCKRSTGNRPKDFRDRFATRLRDADFNQTIIERLMGHSATTTNISYRGKNWDRYVEMIYSIS